MIQVCLLQCRRKDEGSSGTGCQLCPYCIVVLLSPLYNQGGGMYFIVLRMILAGYHGV